MSTPILSGLFTRPSLNFLLGPLWSKKTWVALDLAVSCALGRDGWLGLGYTQAVLRASRLCERGKPSLRGESVPVLYVDEDSSLAYFQSRLRRVLLAHRAIPGTPVHFISRPRYDFARPQDVADLAADSKAVGACLVVIDMPINFALHNDGLDPLAHHRALTGLLDLAEAAHAAVLVIQHTQKRRSTLATALVSAGAAHVLAVDCDFDQPTIHLRTLASCGLDAISITAQAWIGRDSFFLSPSSVKPSSSLGPAGHELLRYLARFGRASTRDLMLNLISAVPTRVRTLIHELVRDGFIHCTQRGASGHPAVYALTPAGSRLI